MIQFLSYMMSISLKLFFFIEIINLIIIEYFSLSRYLNYINAYNVQVFSILTCSLWLID